MQIFPLKGGAILPLMIGLLMTGNLVDDRSKIQAVFNEATLRQAGEMVAGMTIEEKVGQMFMLDFRKIKGEAVTRIHEEIVETIRKVVPGGIILFEENTVDAHQTRRLIEDFQRSSPKIPLFVAVDQEGGAVTRMKYATTMPGNMALGATGDEGLAYRAARMLGKELKALGFNLNFAPVIDVNNNPGNPIIGVRSFGSDPDLVSRMGLKFMKGLNDAGIISAVKHFPGHGDTGVDSHIDLPTIAHDMERLNSVELKPYIAMIKHQAEMIMTAHITFPAIEENPELQIPSTLSARCLTGLLREQMGFQGVIITDALDMKAITKRYGQCQAAEMAILAGADILLMPREIDVTIPYIIQQVKRGNIPETRIDAAVQRILALKHKRGILQQKTAQSAATGPNPNVLKNVGGPAGTRLQKKIAAKAVTLVKNTGQMLPFRLLKGQKAVFFVPSSKGLNAVESAINATFPGIQLDGELINYENLEQLTAEHRRAVTGADYIILFTRTVTARDMSPVSSSEAAYAGKLVAYANALNKKITAVAVRNPYDIQFIPEVKGYLAVYSDWNGGGVEAAIRTIFGKINPSGKLPVSVLDKNGEIIYPFGWGMRYSGMAGTDNE